MSAVSSVSPVPASLEVFLDARGDERALRATWHAEAGVVVFSLWRYGFCAGTFRLDVADAPAMIAMLRQGLEGAYDGAREAIALASEATDEARDETEQAAPRHLRETFEETDAFEREGFFGGFRGFEDEAG